MSDTMSVKENNAGGSSSPHALPVDRSLVGHFDDGFDDARFRFGQCVEVAYNIIEICAMSNPGIGVNRSVFDQSDDASEVSWQSVA